MKRSLIGILLLASIVLLAVTTAQEPTGVDFPLDGQPITIEDVRIHSDLRRAEIKLRNTSERPVRARVRAGDTFCGSGRQAIMALGSSVLPLPPGPTGRWFELPPVICAEANRPDPVAGGGWEHLSDPSEAMVEKQRFLRQLAGGLERVDEEVRHLARNVRLREAVGETAIEYQGEPLDEASAELLRAADWSVTPDAASGGVLNRSVVVQFAFWSLTDNYTEENLDQRIHEERFESAQERIASVRWAVRHLLEKSGFKPDLFDPFSAEVAYNRGVDALRSGEPLIAEQHLRTALQRRDDYGHAHFNLGLALAMQQRWGEAEASFHAAHRLMPQDADIPYNLGVLAYRHDDPEKAAEYFQQSLRLCPGHELASLWLARASRRVSTR